MSEKMTSINPNILIWCREASGISFEEASLKFGAEKIQNWENGNDFPTYNQLKQLCDFYRKPVAICFFPEPPVYKSLTSSFRTIPSVIESSILSRNIINLLDDARIMQLNLYELNESVNVRFSYFSSMIFSSDIPTKAQQLRKVLDVELSKQKSIKSSSDHFEFWREKFSEIGIYVFKDSFGNNDISGFCLYDNTFPIIYINNSLAFTRQTFTLFHELCHIIQRTSGIDMLNDQFYHAHLSDSDLSIERACNSFAGAFLVPDDDFLKTISGKKPTEELVSRLATTYGVSREVVLRKFLNIQWITSDEYTERSSQYLDDYFRYKDVAKEQKKPGGNYYNTQASYKGRQYTELVFKEYYSNKISLAQAAKYMNMKIPSIRAFAEKRGWGSL
jgi:Zn-dependent peptidase ImmA (M78 family)